MVVSLEPCWFPEWALRGQLERRYQRLLPSTSLGQKIKYMFLRHFFSEKDAGGWLVIFYFLPFANKNDVPTMNRENFRLLISGAESRECVHQNSTTHPTIHTTEQGL